MWRSEGYGVAVGRSQGALWRAGSRRPGYSWRSGGWSGCSRPGSRPYSCGVLLNLGDRGYTIDERIHVLPW